MLDEVVEYHDGTLCRNETLIEVEGKLLSVSFDTSTVSSETRSPIEAIARDKALAIAFLVRSDRSRYGQLLDNLESQLFLGTDYQYPVDLSSALTTLDFVKTSSTQHTSRYLHLQDESNRIDMTFVQPGPPVPGTDGVTHD